MNFNEVDQASGYAIQSYDHDQITVSGKRFNTNLIVMPERLIEGWTTNQPQALSEEDFEILAGLEVQVVILGTGSGQAFPHPSLYHALIEKGIGIEVMTTAAACRTYNILLNEGRTVAAALMLG